MLEKAIEILKIFKDNGFEAYIVGGFVRDYVLGKESLDIDISTSATPKDIQKLFSSVSKFSKEQYGSVNVLYKKCNFEITTYRMELEYKDNRYPSKIVYTDSLLIDLKRRDFTMNTLCMDENLKIKDVLNVTKDIKNKVIKCVGNADDRLNEDALRILRAIRFATILNFDIDDRLNDAIFNNRHLLKDLSYFRKKQELNKIFASSNALKGIELIKKYGLEKYLGINLEKSIVKTNDPLGIWVQVNPEEDYPFTNNEKDYMKTIKAILRDKSINDIELYRYGNYVCYIAAQILGIDEINIYDRYDNLVISKQSDVELSQKDIIDILKLEDKSISKEIFKELEEKIILKEIENKKELLEKYVIDTYGNIML